MRLFIVGATGGIGRHLLRIGLERGHELTAYVRSPQKISPLPESLELVRGDLFNSGETARALAGHDTVLSAFGPTTIWPTTLRRDFGRTLAAAMLESGVRRVQLVSAAFLFPKIGLVGELLKPTVFRFMAPDMADMEREIMKDELEWTIVRPPRLTNAPARPDPRLDKYEWERIADAGTLQKDLRISDPGKSPGQRIVAFEQQGTYVKISSDLGRTQLINLALSFTAAKGQRAAN